VVFLAVLIAGSTHFQLSYIDPIARFEIQWIPKIQLFPRF
jgi:hypothetical protein